MSIILLDLYANYFHNINFMVPSIMLLFINMAVSLHIWKTWIRTTDLSRVALRAWYRLFQFHASAQTIEKNPIWGMGISVWPKYIFWIRKLSLSTTTETAWSLKTSQQNWSIWYFSVTNCFVGRVPILIIYSDKSCCPHSFKTIWMAFRILLSSKMLWKRSVLPSGFKSCFVNPS